MKTQPNITGLKGHLGFWMRLVSNHVSHAFSLKVAAHNVTVAEWVVLREMFASDATSPSILADSIGLTRGAVSKLIERLREKQLLTRTEDQHDRRYQQVSLTSAGRNLVPKLAALADQNDAEFFSHLTAAERKILMATLQKLAAANNLHDLPTE
ncbi:MAG: MarR family transcriptional regulator [Acidobacteriota bacterium]